jgi:UDP-N-acetylglucosamine:LPS N-acetylglucosamine transferase
VHSGLKKYEYIGPLSRLKHRAFRTTNELIVILSGPEPERTRFEKMIIKQLESASFNSILVRGTNKKREGNQIYHNIDIYNLLTGFDLNKLISKSKYLLARSGYSTIMDLFHLKKKAILVPTPGQTEQEYLANYLNKEAIFYSCSEKELDLVNAINEVNEYPGFSDIVVREMNYDELICKLLFRH